VNLGELVVVRHADTDWSESGQHTGRTDLPLNRDGRAAAERLTERLAGRRFAAVWCSPLRRAIETCEIAGFGGAAHERAELLEWDYGDYEGLTTEQIHDHRPRWDLWRDGCPGGEDAAAVGDRADQVLASVPGAGTVLVFSHGHFLRVLIARWLALAPAQGALFLLSPGAIGVLTYEHDRHVLGSLG
jgi:broad specificity phosphatase PhoE